MQVLVTPNGATTTRLDQSWFKFDDNNTKNGEFCIVFSKLCLVIFQERPFGDSKRTCGNQMILWVFRGVKYYILYTICLWNTC
uniref:Uncharacterized protein n=1 Tax=Anguilla anguilla TaxID=7936 RepID=A0A0E9X627_ANGAN